MTTHHTTRVRETGYGLSINSFWNYSTRTADYLPTEYRWPALSVPDFVKSRCTDQTHPGPPYRCGGPFDLWKKTVYGTDLGSFSATIFNTNGSYNYRTWGTWRPTPGLLNYTNPTGWLSSWGDGSTYGATGWNKFKPGKPGASLSVFLGELRDVPRMFQFKLREFRDIGSQYLNYQFGWKPFLNDLGKFLKTTQQLERRLQYFRNNNGKPIRRGGVVRQVETGSKTTVSGSCFSPPTIYPWCVYPYPNPSQYHEREVYDYQRIWFDAVFQFWIPDIGSMDWISRVKRQMYGFSLSPSVVWELIPWSWLIDWYTNVGDVMSNLSADDSAEGLVAKYAYLMTHTIRRVTFVPRQFDYVKSKVGLMGSGEKVSSAVHPWYIQWERKQRVSASPFGFGLTENDLTLRQMAILAALGISRRW